MLLLLASLGILIAGAVAAAAIRSPAGSARAAVGSVVAAACIGLVPAIRVLTTGDTVSIREGWNVPYGSFSLQIDALSAFFLLPIFGLSALSAVYGAEYLKNHARHDGDSPRSVHWAGAPWFFYNTLVASMVLVVVARNGVLFLVAWEAMSLSSFFLVTQEHEKEGVRRAGLTYLIATHLGTGCLFVFFLSMGRGNATLDFDQFPRLGGSAAWFPLVLALVGFGTKAGLVPFHVWLPEAHPAAPSHVSALMSGVMIKTGIYGILRTSTFVDSMPAGFGWCLVAAGLVSGMLGVIHSLAQHDLKRLLAYSSVENIGIITAALGLGFLGIENNNPGLAALGFAGALLHALHHAMFKGLLFFGAGSVLHSTGTAKLDRLGGLLKQMPWTGAAFFIASIAICGLPPLNGFISEFTIYLAAFSGSGGASADPAPGLATVAVLALIGGLALATFTKAFGAAFLGTRRDSTIREPHEAPLAMRIPMIALAGICILSAVLSPFWVTRVLEYPVSEISKLAIETTRAQLTPLAELLQFVIAGFGALLALGTTIALTRRQLLRRREVRTAHTWNCGYHQNIPRAQYTASSFGQPVAQLFQFALHTHVSLAPPEGLFPSKASIATEPRDSIHRDVYARSFRAMMWFAERLRFIQHGRVHLYVLYIAITLLVFLAWKLVP